MKLVIRAAVFNILCIIIFGLIYLSLKTHFTKDETAQKIIYGEPIDFFFLSTTVQAGVGYQDLTAFTNVSKFVLMIQQFGMITSNILLLYVFTH
jgi:hypothetical protein